MPSYMNDRLTKKTLTMSILVMSIKCDKSEISIFLNHLALELQYQNDLQKARI